MEIEDLKEEDEGLYFRCLESWDTDIGKNTTRRKERWYRHKKEKGLRVKVARGDDGRLGGMIHYLPIEETAIMGENLFFVLCIWVPPKKGRPATLRGTGAGSALLKSAEADAAASGVAGLVCWGLTIPAFMRAAWFRQHGYRETDREGIMSLLWKPLLEGTAPPRWNRPVRTPQAEGGKTTVDVFCSGWCPAGNLAFDRVQRVAEEFGPGVIYREYDGDDPAVQATWGVGDALYIDGKEVRTGPPPSYRKLRRIVSRSQKKKRMKVSTDR